MAVKSVGLLVTAGFLFVFLGAGLIGSVTYLLRGNQKSVLNILPLAFEQEVRIDHPGEVVLLMEVPRLAADFRNFQIDLTNLQTGQWTSMHYHYLTAQKSVYGVTTMKVPFGGLTNAAPATYSMHVSGLEPGKDYSSYRLILSRPYMGRMALQIIAIVICGVGMLLSVIWACWLLGLMQQPK